MNPHEFKLPHFFPMKISSWLYSDTHNMCILYAWMTSEWRLLEESLAQMPKSLALGAAGGSASTFLLGVLRYLAHEEVLPPVPECFCPETTTIDLEFQQPQVYVFLAGLSLGVLLGPIVDLVWILREKWRRFVWARLGATHGPLQKPYYKVL